MLPSSNGSDHAMLNCRHRQSQQISSPFSGEGALDLLGGYFSETRQWLVMVLDGKGLFLVQN